MFPYDGENEDVDEGDDEADMCELYQCHEGWSWQDGVWVDVDGPRRLRIVCLNCWFVWIYIWGSRQLFLTVTGSLKIRSGDHHQNSEMSYKKLSWTDKSVPKKPRVATNGSYAPKQK